MQIDLVTASSAPPAHRVLAFVDGSPLWFESPDLDLQAAPEAYGSALMFAALNEQDFLCRVFGKCLAGDLLDREVWDMIGKRGPVQPKLFTYVRYNAELTRAGLDAVGLDDVEPANVQQLDSVEFVRDLQRVGQAVAQKNVKAEHFADF